MSKIEDAFLTFHEANPQVYRFLEQRARQAHAAGRTRIGINLLLELFRWHTLMTTTGDVFKVNNNYAPLYARMILANNPDLEGLFVLRRMRTEVAA